MIGFLLQSRTFVHLSFAAALHAFVGYGVAAFLVSFYVRSYAIPIDQISIVALPLGFIIGIGGAIGPALDTIATRKQEDYILQSLVDPGATIAEGFEGKVSPMPPMGVLLKPQELADVMAYMMTLK